MSVRIGFDNDKYLKTQSEHIKERIQKFGGKLYLEFGGKLFDDYHASRVLPGFHPDSKISMLVKLREKTEIVIAISAADIEKNKVRGDLGITYDMDLLRLVDAFTGYGLYVGSVVLTQWSEQPAAVAYEKKLKALGLRTYRHYPIAGYPSAPSLIVSDEGYGRNDYIETTHPLVVVTAPGPGSGKMATCLSQIYHEQKRGIKAGYAKFETFPIWNLPLKHPVNLAYEAATADLNDVNMIDPFHLAAYGETTVNYNRDVEVFPVLQAIFEKIMGKCPYKSPTDMGVNMVGNCITDDDVVCEASRQEIVRRYYAALCDRRRGTGTDETVFKLELLMKQADITDAIRPVVARAAQEEEQTGLPAVCIHLPSGELIVGGTSELMGPAAAAILNAVKALAHIEHSRHLVARSAIEPIQSLKIDHLGSKNPRLHSDEVLIALAISASTDEYAAKAMKKLSRLKDCEVHSTVILPEQDAATYARLGMRVTCTPKYQSKNLFHK
jgi:uncharacterized protein (UPF0371 family)